ncbi:TrbG/VirB9 family P-type conjugative transfer protein [Shewanella sp. M16]|uniref:TrbG/VirB9 family P-type conjugative transfer protein n=1 Tax=Shewanella sp. M16 TaxID=2830837 RepID=UPI001BAEB29E|nr:TrbG/VirB9 family P-type conjugative transfer protein [Shewanella sp. M16]MBS0044838.1 TrbG/VirB9 family P-type conjugative transfer protein [Shewanella sp. M16]
MRILIALIFLIPSCSAFAAVSPKNQGYDDRIALIKYNPKDVIIINTKVGTATLIQLDNGETISKDSAGLGIGDAKAWGFSVRGNNIFLKPTAKKPDTNLTVVSDKGRTYSFDLVSSYSPHYIVKMEYEAVKKAIDYSLKIPCSDGVQNFAYVKWGDQELAPQYMWDDGRFTCLKFTKNAELPVAYQISADGKESLINYHFTEDTMVIRSIASEYRLRLGERVLGLSSSAVEHSGFNHKATSNKATRGLKDE